jgi:hypothetical protein
VITGYKNEVQFLAQRGFPFSTESRPDLEHTELPAQRILNTISPGDKAAKE